MLSQLLMISESKSDPLTNLCGRQEEEVSVHARTQCSLQGPNTRISAALAIVTLYLSKMLHATREVVLSALFSVSHCTYSVENVHHDNSGNGTFDSGSFLCQLLTLLQSLIT